MQRSNRADTNSKADVQVAAAPRIYVGATHQDAAFAERLVRDLRRVLGASDAVRYDVQGSKKGGDAAWQRVMDDLSACPVFIVVLSPDAVASKWVNDQVDVAWQQQNSRQGKFILPVMYRSCPVREDLDMRQVVSFVPATSYEDAFATLLHALGLSASGASAATPPDRRSSASGGVRLGRRELLIGAGVIGVAALGGVGYLAVPRWLTTQTRGKQFWSAPTKPSKASGPLVTGDTLYVGSTEAVLWVVDAGTGAIRGSYSLVTEGSVTRPALQNGILFVAANNFAISDTLYALDTATGQSGPWTTFPIGSGGHVVSAPVVAGGIVYVGSEDTSLYAVSAADGSRVWSKQTQGAITATPVVDGTTVYIASTDHSVYAFDASTDATKQGTLLAQFQTGGPIASAPAVAGGILYVASHDATLYAFETAASGASNSPTWRLTTGGALDGSPVVAGGLVYVGSADGSLYAVDAGSGTKRWSYRAGGAISSTPAVDGSTVYFGSDDGVVYALDAARGSLIWKHSIGAPVRSPLVVAAGTLYVNAEDGNTYAFSV